MRYSNLLKQLLDADVEKDDVITAALACSSAVNHQGQDSKQPEAQGSQGEGDLLRCSSPSYAKEDEGLAKRRTTETAASGSDTSQESKSDVTVGAPTEPPQYKADDPFLYFSSDKRRFEHLLGRELPHMPQEDPTERKTRVSFELDPIFDLTNSFPELFNGSFDQA